ncbi:MAG: hypothetical protein WBO09_10660 [Methylocystis silviterrae]
MSAKTAPTPISSGLEMPGPLADCAPFALRFIPFAPPFDPLAIVRFLIVVMGGARRGGSA